MKVRILLYLAHANEVTKANYHIYINNVTKNWNEPFEKLLDNSNQFQSSSSLLIRGFFVFTVLLVYLLWEFFFSSQFSGSSHRLNFDKFRDKSPLSQSKILVYEFSYFYFY